MVYFRMLVLVLALALVAGALAPASTAQRKKYVAILDFDFNTADQGYIREAYGDVRNLSRQIADRLEVNMVNLGSYTIVERRKVEAVLQEQNLGNQGRLDRDTAAKLGRILGVDSLVIGSITALEMQGMPKNQYQGDPDWDADQLKASIGLSFRLVDATTAKMDVASEVVGISSPPSETSSKKTEGGAKKFFKGILKDKYGNKSSEKNKAPTVEDYKRVIRLAIDDAVVKMAQQLDQSDANARKLNTAKDTPLVVINGKIHRVKGTTVIITGLTAADVKVGDRLFVRRLTIDRDPATGKQISYSEKVGEVEVNEIQEAVIIGTFSGAEAAKPGDIVTNK